MIKIFIVGFACGITCGAVCGALWIMTKVERYKPWWKKGE